jgi:hypothetical protein
MATKAKPKKPAKLKGGAKDLVVAGAKAGYNALTKKKKGKGGKRRSKKSALWYAKEIQRIKLKKRYEKTKLGLGRY